MIMLICMYFKTLFTEKIVTFIFETNMSIGKVVQSADDNRHVKVKNLIF
jgi:hypothetical protein